jgi:two-component system, OmpR family, response regulator
MPEHKVLIVEDDETLRGVLKYNLAKEGYTVFTAADGLQAVETARREKPSLILLDLMLPKLDGLEVCRILRREMSVPILMLTAKAEEIDRIVGLEIGADDYLTKPFSLRELLARVHAILRRAEMDKNEAQRSEAPPGRIIRAGDLEIDPSRHTVLCRGRALDLNPREFDLLVFLARNHGQVFGRETLLEKVWGYDYAGDTRTVDVHIRWLREKVETNPETPAHLITVRGVGYKFMA